MLLHRCVTSDQGYCRAPRHDEDFEHIALPENENDKGQRLTCNNSYFLSEYLNLSSLCFPFFVLLCNLRLSAGINYYKMPKYIVLKYLIDGHSLLN